PQLKQEAQQLDSYLSFLTNSSYMDMLSEYSTALYTIGRGSFEQGLIVPNTLGTVVSEQQIQQTLNGKPGWLEPFSGENGSSHPGFRPPLAFPNPASFPNPEAMARYGMSQL